jgi:hypothetical protein
VTLGQDALGSRDLDPLSGSSVGTALASAASLVWPELLAGAVSLAAMATFLVWIQVVGRLRRRESPGYSSVGLLSLLAVGGGGWGAALLLGPVSPAARALALGAMSLGLWWRVRTLGAGGRM